MPIKKIEKEKGEWTHSEIRSFKKEGNSVSYDSDGPS